VTGASPAGSEVVLELLVERKTAADLVSSIRSGRLAEQAYFMATTGRPSLVCVVEGDVNEAVGGDLELSRRVSSYLAKLRTSGGFVKRQNEIVYETAAYNASLVKHRGDRLSRPDGLAALLNARFEEDAASTVPGVSAAHSFEGWVSAMQNMRDDTTVEQLWAMQLHDLPDVGPARIDTILSAGFKTPAALPSAYASLRSDEVGRLFLARLPPPPRRAPISARLSACNYELFCSKSYGSRML